MNGEMLLSSWARGGKRSGREDNERMKRVRVEKRRDWEKMIEDLKREQEEEIKRREERQK